MSITVSWRKYEDKNKQITRSISLDTIDGKEISCVWLYLKNELQIPGNDVITRHDVNNFIVGSNYKLKDGDNLILETTYIERR